ncbi:uncharacterized protein LOC106653421 [Trichogramma pretiosum]|uniref:uncharacterized protein LOC106653421 n=1 Tax=Trichogramma pretiosum TaxID=7493 RepID=UPI0006C98A59|nr:uncharacterized protein LOC106653421 [Trichogramma pretiosum]XP_014228339.1 uncharacterized protein LOC106653421 [Trichogramma pretiosum]XP_014228340.1 uncharacterized protein LOC106653421 [Trichogramma pretiosum]XP_014228341.1 uncharacterized protein LOC106653421 [Trichogramma pretiosum]
MAQKRPQYGEYADESFSSDDDYYPDDAMEERQRGSSTSSSRRRSTSTSNNNNNNRQATSSATTTSSSHGAAGGQDDPQQMEQQPQQQQQQAPGTGARRRGRGPSKRPCLNKNALMARENRQRKKEYVEKIEAELASLQKENQELQSTIESQSGEIKKLSCEVKYLKNVLRNDTLVTTLMKAMNDSLKKLHGGKGRPRDAATDTVIESSGSTTPRDESEGLSKPCPELMNHISNEQNISPKSPNRSVTVSGTSDVNDKLASSKIINKVTFGQSNQPTAKIARKTMPLVTLKTENPPSNASSMDDYEMHYAMNSPQSSIYCEYNTDESPAGLSTGPVVTPLRSMSHSMDNFEGSLSDGFSHLSSLDVDMLNSLEKDGNIDNPLSLDQDDSNLFTEDAMFHTFDEILKNINDESNIVLDSQQDLCPAKDPVKESNNFSFFNAPDNPGVCLHINSSRVSLEYCVYCHNNSLQSQTVM